MITDNNIAWMRDSEIFNNKINNYIQKELNNQNFNSRISHIKTRMTSLDNHYIDLENRIKNNEYTFDKFKLLLESDINSKITDTFKNNINNVMTEMTEMIQEEFNKKIGEFDKELNKNMNDKLTKFQEKDELYKYYIDISEKKINDKLSIKLNKEFEEIQNKINKLKYTNFMLGLTICGLGLGFVLLLSFISSSFNNNDNIVIKYIEKHIEKPIEKQFEKIIYPTPYVGY